MGVSPQLVIAVAGAASAIATAIFWGAYHLGKFMSRLEKVETTLDEHSEIIREFKGAL